MAGNLDKIVAALLGPKPFNPETNTPRDVGLGGPSTEYIATSQDENGVPFNFPRIWWTNGEPMLLPEEEARYRALQYEQATGERFPRFDTFGAGGFSAMNRSAMGGAQLGPLTSRLRR